MASGEEKALNIEQFLTTIRRYAEITELTSAIVVVYIPSMEELNALIDKREKEREQQQRTAQLPYTAPYIRITSLRNRP